MTARPTLDTIDLRLVRVLHTVIQERSVSRAAIKLDSTQPAVSAQLRRLRLLTGDPLLVRAGQRMQPTETALQLLDPAARVLQDAARLFNPAARRAAFDPADSALRFRVAASDQLDPLFLPWLVAHLKRAAPGVQLELTALPPHDELQRRLAAGEVDLVIGNGLELPQDLHRAQLLSDEMVCLVAEDHPALQHGWTAQDYFECEHVAPMPAQPGALDAIDQHLAVAAGERCIAVHAAQLGLAPLMVAGTLLVLTAGRLFCSRYAATLPVRIVRCPVAFPPLGCFQLWHTLTHDEASMCWLREQVREVAQQLPGPELPPRSML